MRMNPELHPSAFVLYPRVLPGLSIKAMMLARRQLSINVPYVDSGSTVGLANDFRPTCSPLYEHPVPMSSTIISPHRAAITVLPLSDLSRIM